ncbi:MAG: hypothetical protein EHM70_25835 [Chloroflexota bacterium]|nr:MAG: hypothetical protein EHM70_25835 [Chloroflexota bacterium]
MRSKEEAIDYVNERGFIYFWPIKDVTFPSLWTAVAGDRPVADAHDDPGHVTWGWKDSLLGKNVWYYAKVLRKRATIISNTVLPYFYALTENYGSPEEDYLTLYQQGRMTLESRMVYEALLKEGPLDTIALRKATHLTSAESDSRFNKALTDLQAGFLIVPVAVTEAGRWRYAFAYDVVARHLPDLIDRTRMIGERQARQKLAELFFGSVGAARLADLARLFGWPALEAGRTVDLMVQAGLVRRGLQMPGQPGEWCALSELC